MTIPSFEPPDTRDPIRDREMGHVISALLSRPLLVAEADPDVFQLAVRHKVPLEGWFRNVGWEAKVYLLDGIIRLYKRSAHPPGDRGPRLERDDPPARRPAPPLVLVLMCLICEQLWRHPETGFNDLQKALVQTCATEAGRGTLPRFNPVDTVGGERARANTDRGALVDALLVLQRLNIIVADRPLDSARKDTEADLLITTRQERLAKLLACPSPSLLRIDLAEPESMVAALCSDQAELPEHASANQGAQRRRHLALRAVLDDPAVDPDPDTDHGRYLASGTGRNQALETAHLAGLVCTVRRDWWSISDPAGNCTDIEFPGGRSQEHQGALVLLAALCDRADPRAPFALEDAEAVLAERLERLPWWGSRYRTGRGARRLAEASAAILEQAGLLHPPIARTWEPTPGIGTWRVSVLEPETRTPRHDGGHND